jgi:hypothetical protein
VSENGTGARLVWLRPGAEPLAFPLAGDGPLHLGREGVDLLVDEPLVSRCHARLERRDGRWYVLDLESTNRTRVNGAVVGEACLADGDEVRFGRAVCRFEAGPAVEAVPEAAVPETALPEAAVPEEPPA